MVTIIDILKKTHDIEYWDDIEKIDFTNEKCKITVVNFCNDLIYILYTTKYRKVLIKLNKSQRNNLLKKLLGNRDKILKNNEIHQKFIHTLKKVKKINIILKELLEKKTSLFLFDNKDKIKNIEKKILQLCNKKEEIQKHILTWMDFIIEDNILFKNILK